MSKTKFAIIGDPISHSLSPFLHNYWFKKYQIDAEYSLLNIQPDEIEKTIDKVKKKEIKGINVTLPYKRSVIPFLSKTVNDATQTHSVNTILLDENESIIGENTDVFGFQAAYLKSISELEKKNKRALILGAGGVAPSIILAFTKPILLLYPYRAWMKLGHILGWVNSRIILGLVFLIVLQPIAFIMRILGHDPLRTKKDTQKSYREIKTNYKVNLKKIF